MDCLRFVANAIRHAEAFADEAEDIERHRLSERLNTLAQELSAVLDLAFATKDAVPALRETRTQAHQGLGAAYHDASSHLRTALGAQQAALYSPGSYLDVADRTRFRIARLTNEPMEATERIRKKLVHALAKYDDVVMQYLDACARCLAAKEEAIALSQVARVKLEQAKTHLLTHVPPGGPAFARIKARAVRTKPARWTNNMDTKKGLMILTVSQDMPVSMTPRTL